MNNLLDHQTFKTNKERLNTAFRALRKQGILAKQNFTCCQTCGFAELADEAMILAQKGRKIEGCVFYHKHDNEYLRANGECCLSFSGFDFSEKVSDAALDEATVMVARIAVAILSRHGIKTDWNETAGRRIRIDLTCEYIGQLD